MAPTTTQCSLGPQVTYSSQLKRAGLLVLGLVLCFFKPLYALTTFALHSDLFSYVLLVPVVAVYLAWLKKETLPPASAPRSGLAMLLAAAAAGALALSWAGGAGAQMFWRILAFTLLIQAAACFSFGPPTLRHWCFPLVFLLLGVPLPPAIVNGIEGFLQVSSAWAADLFFTLTGMSFIRSGLLFQLPGIRLQVAPECSGIHSTLVLFITSLVAGQLFLSRNTHRAILALAVLPLGIFRNALRIWTLGELCVHVSPAMIDSPIHHRGGPLFFAISLVPLFLLLFYLRRISAKGNQKKPNTPL